jgi:hypothetical protein
VQYSCTEDKKKIPEHATKENNQITKEESIIRLKKYISLTQVSSYL